MATWNTRVGHGPAYRWGVAIAAVTAFLIVWTTIVRDDDNGAGFFMIIMAAAVGAFAAGFQAAGLARAMAGVAVMQLALGTLIATAPVTARIPGGPLHFLLASGVFAALWLTSAALFRVAAARERQRS